MNHAKKSEYSIKQVKYTEKFSSVVQNYNLDVGYIKPGHGVKGRQMWLETEDDLHEM